ncbi:MAG: hypothetical protein ABIJ75_05890 [Actinomycetota bacterium]
MPIDPNNQNAIYQTQVIIEAGIAEADNKSFWLWAHLLKAAPIDQDVFATYMALHHQKLTAGEGLWEECAKIAEFLEWDKDKTESPDPTDP